MVFIRTKNQYPDKRKTEAALKSHRQTIQCALDTKVFKHLSFDKVVDSTVLYCFYDKIMIKL